MAGITRCHPRTANVRTRHMDSLRSVVVSLTLRSATCSPSASSLSSPRPSSLICTSLRCSCSGIPPTHKLSLGMIICSSASLSKLSPTSSPSFLPFSLPLCSSPLLSLLPPSAMASLASASLLNRTVSVLSSSVSCRNVVSQKVSCVSFSGLRARTSQRVSIVESRSVAAARLRLISCAAEGAEEAVAAPATKAPGGNVAEIVREVIAQQLASPIEKVLPDSKFADLGADSLDTVEIMMALEERFDITIDEDGAEKISTVQEAADLIEAEIRSRA